jgi:hypothetical protein
MNYIFSHNLAIKQLAMQVLSFSISVDIDSSIA